MNSASLLTLYLCMQALLLASCALFVLLRSMIRVLGLSAAHRPWITIAQFFIALSLALPPVLHALPVKSLPPIDWSALRPAQESRLRLPKKEKSASNLPMVVTNTAVRKRITVSQFTAFVDHLRRFLTTSSAVNLVGLLLCLGSLVMCARLVVGAVRLHRLLRLSMSVRRLSRVRVFVSEATVVPFSVLLGGNAVVVLPQRLLGHARDYRLAVRHELQHHRQRDTAWAIVVELLVCFFYLNPAIWIFKREIVELQEFSCDEALLGQSRISPHDYGSCLVRVAEAALGSRSMHVGTTCMAGASRNPFYFKSFLRRRVEMFNDKRPSARRWVVGAVGTLGAVLTVALAYGAEQSTRPALEKTVNAGTVVVDPAIQRIAEEALADAIKSERAKAGFAIVADPSNGKILAVANIDTTGKLTGHWALAQVLEPASIAKGIVVAQAIDSGMTTPEANHACENGNYRYGDRVYHDWKKGGWSQLTTTETIEFSSDICAMKIGEEVGVEGLLKMLADFGFGPEGTARSFPEARPGELPPLGNPYYPEIVPAVSIGFGFRSTPLELVQAYGSIANGGNLYMPRQANDDSAAEPLRRVLSPASAAQTKEILRQVVLKGTGKVNAESKLYTTAGKTATSYDPDLTKWAVLDDVKNGNFAGFIGFSPVKDPRVEVYVGIRDPQSGEGGAHGSTHAAPVFKRIAENVLKYWNVAPDKATE